MQRRIETAIAPHALLLAGGVHEGGDTIWLLAPDTTRFWDHLSTQPEGRDGLPDRVDRWSSRILPQIAQACEAEALLPFGGPPWHPFIAWATRTGQAWQSPVGPLVHAKMGLWLSFRGALRQRGLHPLPTASQKPCETCSKPCLTTCPVGALGAGNYDVAACRAHVATAAGAACRTGCLVRKACPVGVEFTLPPAQGQHHMRAFLGHQP